MDDGRFDGITKALAGGTGRRAVLKRLAGGILAGGFAVLGTERVAATPGPHGHPHPRHPVCHGEGQSCNRLHPCCAGTTCTGGYCVAPPVCENPAFCNGFHPCCAGSICTGAGQCVATPACVGGSCNVNHPCCANTACTSATTAEGQCILA